VIRTNLSTRPFYNEGAVRLWLLLLAIAVVLATVFNVTRLLQYSRSDTELATQASRDEARTAELRASAAELRASVDVRQISEASNEARVANDLIDRRTFSWTELFNRFETTLPAEVRITAVRPRIERDRRIILTIAVLSRSVQDVDDFMTNLEDTGAFKGLGAHLDEHMNEQGQLESILETEYTPRNLGTARPAPTPDRAEPAGDAGGRQGTR
jgi:Tfp pilus assembly protein PilN